MKVYGPSRPEPLSPRSKAARRSADGGRPTRTDAREQVDVSSRAQVLARAREPQTPDRARIERLKEAIRSGQFQVDAERIAAVMLREEQ